MLSSKAKYALRAILNLAGKAASGVWLQTADVAEQEKLPRKFLEAIFVQLRDHGVVESRRGAQGGHRLSVDPAAVSVADVIRIVDGPLALTPCASRTRYRPCSDCVDVDQCQLHPLMLQARDAVAGVLEACTLAQLTVGQLNDGQLTPAKHASGRSAAKPVSRRSGTRPKPNNPPGTRRAAIRAVTLPRSD